VVDWLETVTSVVYLGGMGIDWLHTLTGLTQLIQSFIWGMGIDWLDTVTSVVFLGVWRYTDFTVTSVVPPDKRLK
jgi:hypothetical protein